MKTLPNDELLEVLESNGFVPAGGNGNRLEFKDLMKFRIEKILLVCSFYDYYTIVDDGHLQEALFNEYLELNLYYAPHITRAFSGESARKMLEEDEFDLVIVTLRLGDMELPEFAEEIKSEYPGLPLVLLASHSRELETQIRHGRLDAIDKIFIWSGDRKIFLAIIKQFEDVRNAPHDCLDHGVTTIVLVEDSPTFYSAYLPLIYTEVMKQSQKLIEEGRNSAEKLLRQRARPKILHARNYEEAKEFIETYRDSLLGVITDMKFDIGGRQDPRAGVRLIEETRRNLDKLPILLQTSQIEQKDIAEKYDVAFLDKNSRTLLIELREFMKKNFGFGDFIFRMPDGRKIKSAKNLRELRDNIKYIPVESLLYHARQNHFSHWLIARTQFELAYRIRPVHISQFDNADELRKYLVATLSEQMRSERRGVITVFSRNEYDSSHIFQMIGEGSLGGKARGLAFIDKILKNYLSGDHFPGVEISIPRTIVLGTDVFTQFMENNDLYRTAVQNMPDEQIVREFLRADLPPTVLGDLREILNHARFPIAVRSSSLLEDAVYQPFAGIYATVMIPNSNNNLQVRFHNLVQAIKYVYASTFFRNAKNYIEATGNRIEEEKMGVILQEVVGAFRGNYYYPHFSGVAKSYNYYPFGKAKPKDGVVNLALGLGKTIVDGGVSLQYSPEYPNVYPQFGSRKDLFDKSQTKFWALDMQSDIIRKNPHEDQHLEQLSIQKAEQHEMLNFLASTYSADNDMIYEGITRKGPRILNFAPILKSGVVPLNQILQLLLKMSEVAMNSPAEIEFAVILGRDRPLPAKFGFLQVRPMVKPESNIDIDLGQLENGRIILHSKSALGNGLYELDYILFVKYENFNAAKTRQIGEEINRINLKLLKEKKNYLLIGPGRWGSSDPWLGIPVQFSYISGAQVIVETQMPHMSVDPSQGSHFFHNMTSFKIAYITMERYDHEKDIDWRWINSQPTEYESEFLKLVRTENPIEIKVDGQTGQCVVLKGDAS